MSAEYFSAGSSDYARYRPRYPEDWFDWLAAQCAERSLAWDCACGSGQATEELARRFEKVIATDASAAQLQNAPLLPNVEWRLASGEASGLGAGRVDLVTVAQALHWLDLPRFLQECYRVLKPEGIIAVWGYGIASLSHPSANQIFQDFYHGVVGEYWPKERRMVEEGYAGIDFPFQEIPVSAFEMVQSWDVEHLAGYCSSWSATDRYRKATGHDPIPELRAKLTRELGSAPTEIRWPFFAKVGRLFHVEQNAEEEN
jgi:SAM-dependent methyltransferase